MEKDKAQMARSADVVASRDIQPTPLLQLKQSLAQMTYEEQVAAIQPEMPSQFNVAALTDPETRHPTGAVKSGKPESGLVQRQEDTEASEPCDLVLDDGTCAVSIAGVPAWQAGSDDETNEQLMVRLEEAHSALTEWSDQYGSAATQALNRDLESGLIALATGCENVFSATADWITAAGRENLSRFASDARDMISEVGLGMTVDVVLDVMDNINLFWSAIANVAEVAIEEHAVRGDIADAGEGHDMLTAAFLQISNETLRSAVMEAATWASNIGGGIAIMRGSTMDFVFGDTVVRSEAGRYEARIDRLVAEGSGREWVAQEIRGLITEIGQRSIELGAIKDYVLTAVASLFRAATSAETAGMEVLREFQSQFADWMTQHPAGRAASEPGCDTPESCMRVYGPD